MPAPVSDPTGRQLSATSHHSPCDDGFSMVGVKQAGETSSSIGPTQSQSGYITISDDENQAGVTRASRKLPNAKRTKRGVEQYIKVSDGDDDFEMSVAPRNPAQDKKKAKQSPSTRYKLAKPRSISPVGTSTDVATPSYSKGKDQQTGAAREVVGQGGGIPGETTSQAEPESEDGKRFDWKGTFGMTSKEVRKTDKWKAIAKKAREEDPWKDMWEEAASLNRPRT